MEDRPKNLLSKRDRALALTGVIVLGLGLRLGLARFFLIGSDLTSAYYPPALSLLGQLETGFQEWTQWHLRLGVILPLSLAHWLTGRADMAVPLAALPFSMSQILAVFLIGRLLWNDQVGLLAAFFEAIYPVSVMFGAKLLPDTPMACWVTIAVLCYFLGHRFHNRWFFLLAGGCIGMGYTAKITALFGLVILGGLASVHRRQLPRWGAALIPLGALLVLAGETLVLSLLNGELHFRPASLLSESGRFVRDQAYDWGLERYIPGFFAGLLWPLNRGFVEHGLFGVATLATLIISFVRSRLQPAFAAVAWWWLGLVFMLNFACLGYSRPVVNTIQMRYLMFITPPACLLVAAGLTGLRRTWQWGVVGGLLVSSLVSSYALYSTWKPHDSGCRHLFSLIEEKTGTATTVYFHDRRSALYAGLVLGGDRHYTIVEQSDQLILARPGDLATLITGGYIREDSLPEGYREQLQCDSWKKIDDWRWRPGLAHAMFQALKIQVKKGLQKHIQVYQHQPDGPSFPGIGEGRRGAGDAAEEDSWKR